MLLLLALACTPEPCGPVHVVVTDIDETLTTLDDEWIDQIIHPEHDPAERPQASALMQGYAERGYALAYLTARGTDLLLDDGRSATQATWDWLEDHGFPLEEGSLHLAEGPAVFGDDAVAHKLGVLEDLKASDHQLDWAYGNAQTDIEAYLAAGMPGERVFLVGELAGTLEVTPLTDDQAYEAHVQEHLTEVEAVDCPGPW